MTDLLRGTPTMADVARLAGVSLMTVSRVVNEQARVGTATRERVKWVIRQLGYVPNAAARTLAGARPERGEAPIHDVADGSVDDRVVRRAMRDLPAADGAGAFARGGVRPAVRSAVPPARRGVRDTGRDGALAHAALPLLAAHGLVYLDNGGAGRLLAELLPRGTALTVATNSIEVAAILAARRDVAIHMVGGQVDGGIGGSVDGVALDAIAHLNIDTCLLGTCMLSSSGGVSALDAADAVFKRALVARSRQTLALATNQGIDACGPHRIADIDRLAQVIVEHDAAAAAVDRLRAAGATIRRAASPLAFRAAPPQGPPDRPPGEAIASRGRSASAGRSRASS